MPTHRFLLLPYLLPFTTAGTTKEGTIEKGPFAGTMIATVHGQTEDSTEAQEGATILPETKNTG